MALISCPECLRQISDQAATCPHCGYPMQARPPVAGPVAGDADARVLQVLLSQGKIQAIKLCRELHPGLGLAEAKERVEKMEAKPPETTVRRVGGVGCLLAAAALLLAAGCWGGAFF